MTTAYEPWDTLFFRDGKPFSMGEDSWATGIFPPWPSTIYGALRTAYLADHPEERAEIDIKTEKLRLSGIHLNEEKRGFIFPAPSDCHMADGRTGTVYLSYRFGKPAGAILSAGYLRVHKRLGTGLSPAQDIFLPLDGLKKYLKDISSDGEQLDLRNAIPKDSLLTYEDKIGLGRDNATRSAQESMLYRVQMQRWEGLSLAVESNLEDLNMDKPAFLRLGGEGKAVRLTDTGPLPEFPEQKEIGPCFKVYLLTPALFDNGWLPGGMSPRQDGYIRGQWRGLEVELLAAFMGKPAPLGGFDIKNRRPKPMQQAVPAGAVYYLRAPGASAEQVNAAFHNRMASDQLPKQGFGHALVGALNHSHFKNLDKHV